MKGLISFALSLALIFSPGVVYSAEGKKSVDAMEESLKVYNKYRHSKSEWIAHYFKGTAQESIVRDAMKDFPEKMPAVQKVGKRYQMMVKNQLVTWQVVDFERGEFLVNGRPFQYDPRKLVVENLDRLEKMFAQQSSYSPLYRLFVPEAQAYLGLAAAGVLAVLLYGGYRVKKWWNSDDPKNRFDSAFGEAEKLCAAGAGSLSESDKESLQDRAPKVTEMLTGMRCVTDDMAQIGIQVHRYFKSLCTKMQSLKDCLENPQNVKDAKALAKAVDTAHAAHVELQRIAQEEARKKGVRQDAQ